jgi:hypothetical protein
MRSLRVTLGVLVLVAVLVAGGIGVGSVLAQGRWNGNRLGTWPMGSGMMGGGWDMMGNGWQNGPVDDTAGGWCGAGSVPGQGKMTSLDEAKAAVEQYLKDLGYSGLQIKEVMEFDRNYYAIVEEEDTGIGAMEVLVDKSSGAVSPEPGPNMMWNAKYGMMGGRGMMGGGGMMGNYSNGEMTVTPQEAEEIGQKWLDANYPGRTAGDADAFYGYYTLHFLKDGEVEGMFSVHGSTGAVWYHSWHGSFVDMIEEHD